MKGRESRGAHCLPGVQSVQRPRTQGICLFQIAKRRSGGDRTELGERRFEVRDLLVHLNGLDLILCREGHD